MSEPRIVRTQEEHNDIFQMFIGRNLVDELILNPTKGTTPEEYYKKVHEWMDECATKYREGKYNAQESKDKGIPSS